MPNPQTPVFPTHVATDLDLTVATNRALSQLTNPIDNHQTSFTVVNGAVYNAPQLVQIDTEIILVGVSSGNVLSQCVRGYSLTSPASHGQNADVKGYVMAYHHNQIAAEIKSIEAGLGANFGNVVMQYDFAGGEIGGIFSDLHLNPNGVIAGTYGGFNTDVLLTVDDTGRVTEISNATGNTNYPVFYKAAIAQGTNAVLGFSFGVLDAPNAVIYTGGSGLVYAVAAFTSGNNYWVQDHFWLPNDWQADAISLDIYWRTAATTGNVVWKCRTGSLNNTVGPDITWNPYVSVSTTVPASADQTVLSTITPLNMTGISAGDELFFQFGRDSSDTALADAELISIKFNINRNFAL